MFKRLQSLAARVSPRVAVGGLAVGSLLASGLASAQTTGGTTSGIDVTSVTAAFGNLDTAIGTVGGLIIAAAALAVTYKWVKGMIFG